jgi:hypothetical protein
MTDLRQSAAPDAEGTRGGAENRADGLTHTVQPDIGAAPVRVARRDFWRQVDRRRRWARALDVYLADVCPAPAPRRPGTYGLSPEDVRAEGNRLVAAGWDVAEVVQVLALPAPGSSR